MLLQHGYSCPNPFLIAPNGGRLIHPVIVMGHSHFFECCTRLVTGSAMSGCLGSVGRYTCADFYGHLEEQT